MLSPFECLCGNFILPEPASYVFFYAFFNLRNLLYLIVDLEPVKELVSLQRRCANNLNQAAIHANSYGGLYPDELKRLQKDYADLWEPLSDLLAQLSAIVTM